MSGLYDPRNGDDPVVVRRLELASPSEPSRSNRFSIYWIRSGAGTLWALCVLGLMRWLRRALHDEVTERVHALAEDRTPVPSRHRAMAVRSDRLTSSPASARL